jgi:hypothetical protein
MDWIIPKLFAFFQERGWGRPALPLYLREEIEKRHSLIGQEAVKSSAGIKSSEASEGI